MVIIGILLLIAGVGVGITEKEYGAMALGIVLGAFLIWYSPKAKAKSEVKKKEKHDKQIKKMIENMSEEELDEFKNNLESVENDLNSINDELDDLHDKMKKN